MICEDLHSALTPILASYDAVCVVADENVKGHRLSVCEHYPTLWLEVSETAKSLTTVERIWDFLFAQRMTRRGLLVCIGGGVLTDLGGFAAATYKRGMNYLNIPTTLLAMIDASTGGKTGLNYGGLKNSIGAFHAPVQTLIAPAFLRTLPPEQLLSGFAEMLKTGLLEQQTSNIQHQTSLWSRLLQYDLDTMPIEPLVPLIADCLAVKERIVAADPQEQGLRKALNLGHTVGHALEEISMSGEAGLLHGYAVLYGLIAELYLSVTRCGCPKEPLQQLTQLMLHYYGRPECKCSDRDRLIDLMRQDKKNEQANDINCTLLRDLGEPLINQLLPPSAISEAIEYLFSL